MAELAYHDLGRVSALKHGEYVSAQPFPHVVMDDLFPVEILDAVLDEFPTLEAIDWRRFKDGTGRKLATRDEGQIGPRTRALLHELNSSRFLKFLEALTGIEGLIPDPHFEGGGLHMIERGGFLKVHADFNRHERLGLDRRLNLLVYLNKDWKEEFGGHFEMWTPEMDRCALKVLPVFNRCVVFSTTDFSYHGHPDPLTCPQDRARKSIALYYYTNGRPESEVSRAHSTLYQRRPGEGVYSVKATTKSFLHGLLTGNKKKDQ